MRWGDAITLYIHFAQLLVERDRRIYREVYMSKLEHLAERAPEIIDSLEKRADALDQRLTKLESRGDQTFGKWEGHLDAQEKAIGVAENAINKLSNVPLADSTTDAKKDPFRQPGTGDGANKGDDKKAQ